MDPTILPGRSDVSPAAADRLIALYALLRAAYGDDGAQECIGIADPCPCCGGPLHFHPRRLSCTRCGVRVDG